MASQILDFCTNCGDCVPVCPVDAIMPGAARHVIDADTCENCALCVAVCPVKAIVNDPPKAKPKTDKSA